MIMARHFDYELPEHPAQKRIPYLCSKRPRYPPEKISISTAIADTLFHSK